MKDFEKYRGVLLAEELFAGIQENDLNSLLSCVGALVRSYEKDGFILRAGDDTNGVGVVLSGSVQIYKEDAVRRTILTNLAPGDLFQEVLACAGIRKSPVFAVAAEPAEVLFLDYGKIAMSCTNACAFHAALIRNMLRILARKNLMLNRKIDLLQIRSLRARLAAYLLSESESAGSLRFEIPYDRSALADYLNADRSALSRELGRMKAEGFIDYYKSSFKLNDVLKLEQVLS